jgi:hypothetical protein
MLCATVSPDVVALPGDVAGVSAGDPPAVGVGVAGSEATVGVGTTADEYLSAAESYAGATVRATVSQPTAAIVARITTEETTLWWFGDMFTSFWLDMQQEISLSEF